MIHDEEIPVLLAVASINLIDGVVSKAETISILPDAAAPPTDLAARHVWDRLPSFEDPDAKDVKDPDIGAEGDGETDDTAALQKAIDQYDPVFLPKGVDLIRGTLRLDANTKFFGTTKAHVDLRAADDWQPTLPAPATADSTSSSAARKGCWSGIVASRGVWKGRRLISDTPLVRGHAGGNGSLMDGWSDTMFSWGQVTASGISTKGLNETVNHSLRGSKL